NLRQRDGTLNLLIVIRICPSRGKPNKRLRVWCIANGVEQNPLRMTGSIAILSLLLDRLLLIHLLRLLLVDLIGEGSNRRRPLRLARSIGEVSRTDPFTLAHDRLFTHRNL